MTTTTTPAGARAETDRIHWEWVRDKIGWGFRRRVLGFAALTESDRDIQRLAPARDVLEEVLDEHMTRTLIVEIAEYVGGRSLEGPMTDPFLSELERVIARGNSAWDSVEDALAHAAHLMDRDLPDVEFDAVHHYGAARRRHNQRVLRDIEGLVAAYDN